MGQSGQGRLFITLSGLVPCLAPEALSYAGPPPLCSWALHAVSSTRRPQIHRSGSTRLSDFDHQSRRAGSLSTHETTLGNEISPDPSPEQSHAASRDELA